MSLIDVDRFLAEVDSDPVEFRLLGRTWHAAPFGEVPAVWTMRARNARRWAPAFIRADTDPDFDLPDAAVAAVAKVGTEEYIRAFLTDDTYEALLAAGANDRQLQAAVGQVVEMHLTGVAPAQVDTAGGDDQADADADEGQVDGQGKDPTPSSTDGGSSSPTSDASTASTSPTRSAA